MSVVIGWEPVLLCRVYVTKINIDSKRFRKIRQCFSEVKGSTKRREGKRKRVKGGGKKRKRECV